MTSLKRVAIITVSEKEVRRDASSYVDPHGFVFHHGGHIYRAIHGHSRSFYESLMSSGELDRLVENFSLVPTDVAELRLAEHEDSLVLKHERIDPLTYCVEWPPSMLRAAALATLHLALELAESGKTLQDAYPWNVLFRGTEPVFVDVTSIVQEDTQVLWPAHEQYESFFYRPLVLSAEGSGSVARALLLDNLSGISLESFCRLVSSGYRWRHPGLAMTRALENRVQRSPKMKKKLREFADSASNKITPELRQRFLKKLISRLPSVRQDTLLDPWSNYYAEIPPEVDKQQKLSTVGRLLEQTGPKTVLDLGCNSGVFSLEAAKTGARVVSIDSSEYCIESLYHRAQEEGKRITPLVMNVLCPTPGFGFLGRQYPPLLERVRSDVVMCLGLMHHLHLIGRQSFARIAEMLDEASREHVIFEFVARDDANIELLPQRRTIDYTLESVTAALAERFSNIQTFDSDRSTRKLLLCSKN